MASRSLGGGTVLASGIRTRERKERKLYSDDWALGDEEIDGFHTFDLDEKIKTPKFDLNFIKDLTDKEFNLGYLQRHGFNWPLLFREASQLGIVIPSEKFSINDVRLCVGSRRMLDVMDVNTQKNVEMTMKDWQRYFESQDKDKLLNVISLEFSHTKLENLVEAPTVVRQIDWVEKVWPRHLKESQTESTNVLEDMMYPKVQKYCLMSVSGCYTDFHIDFGGTSVWYHILKGKKIFWLIPPSERNLQLYEQWVLSGKQSDVFFGDTVDKCARIELKAGYTFFIPTGWIHAVYTPDDSLVFGGNFLHSFGIEKQLRVATVEDTTHVPQKFRYPFFTEMLWYLLERYVHVLLGRTHLSLPDEEEIKYEKCMAKSNNNEKKHIHLTQYELHGMKAIVMFLHSLPTSKKFVPELIKDPIALIRDVRQLVEEHRYDNPEFAVTNKAVLEWWDREPVKFTVKRSYGDSAIYVKKRRGSGDEGRGSSVPRLPPNASKVRHRRIRCKECEPCTRSDCRQCNFCKDMIKYGGGGTMKQTCKSKKCVQPVLPAAAICYICQLDGWFRPVVMPHKTPLSGEPSCVMECILCFKISHAACLETKFKGVDCIVNEDLPNSWECAECIQLGYNKEYKHNRGSSARSSSGGNDVKSPSILTESEDNKSIGPKDEECELKVKPDDVKPAVGIESASNNVTSISPEKIDFVTGLMPRWEQLQARVSKPLAKPMWVIRPVPPPSPPPPEEEGSDLDEEEKLSKKIPPPYMLKEVMLPVFSHLSTTDLLSVMRVCRAWASWSIHPSLWKTISLAHSVPTSFHLKGTVRRQPAKLILDWSQISYDQCLWLICRLPQMQSLHCQGISWGVIRSLVSPYCPVLSELNLSFCEGVDDETLAALLRAPPFNRPGFRDASSRLRQLTELKLSGTLIGDSSVALIARSLPFLVDLDLSCCLRLTNLTPELLSHSTSLVCHSLKCLDLRGCHGLTPLVLPALAELPLLSTLSLDPCELIPYKAIKVWGASNQYSISDEGLMTRVIKEKLPETDLDLEASVKPKQPEKSKEKKQLSSPSKAVDKPDNSKKVKKGSKPTVTQGKKLNKDKSKLTKTDSPTKINKNPPLKVKLKSLNKKSPNLPSKREISDINHPLKVKKEILSAKIDDKGENSSSSDTCRRSMRRNKGKKYKLALAKASSRNKLIRPSEKLIKKSTHVGENKSPLKSKFGKVCLKKSSTKHLKIGKKKIVTRSKGVDEKKVIKSDAFEVINKKTEVKTPKMEEKAKIISETSDLKVLISLKGASKVSTTRRKKSHDGSSSQTEQDDSKRTENSSKKSFKSTDSVGKTVIFSSPKLKKRKERNGSSSSSSSSPASPCITVSKNVKVKLEPLTKFNRRKSDTVKLYNPSLPSSSGKSNAGGTSVSQSSSSSSSEKNSSRERPERSHRSPRRLSTTQ